jgi:hypothetical protein
MSLADSILQTAVIARCVSEAATAADYSIYLHLRKAEPRRDGRGTPPPRRPRTLSTRERRTSMLRAMASTRARSQDASRPRARRPGKPASRLQRLRAGTRATWLTAALLAATACSEPRPPEPAAGTATVNVPPVPSAEPAHAGTSPSSTTTATPDSGAGTTPWQERCATALEAALPAAVALEPGLRGISVKRETQGPSAALLITAFPPVFSTGGLNVRVERTPGRKASDAGPPRWQRFAESLHGGYHATFMRHAGEIQAWMAFDGWRSDRVEVIAPLFQAAIERCDSRP